MKNRYVNRAKISEAKFRDLVRFFALDLTAIQIAEITGLNRNTVNRYLTEIRNKICCYSRLLAPPGLRIPKSETDDDECSFCVLIREQDSLIFTEILPANLVDNDTLDVMKDLEFDILINTKNSTHQFIGNKLSDREKHRRKINRIENFWSIAKSRLAKFKGIHSSTYQLHVKESEFRYNNRNEDLYQLLLKILRKNPLF